MAYSHPLQGTTGSSAPTRGPWIEILADVQGDHVNDVGPHTGAVD